MSDHHRRRSPANTSFGQSRAVEFDIALEFCRQRYPIIRVELAGTVVRGPLNPEIRDHMFCPACNTQNLATTVKCIQCGTTLIYEATGHSAAYIKGARSIDSRTYSLAGFLLCLGLAFVLLKTVLSEWYLDERLIYLASSLAGGIIGRVIAWRKWRTLLRQSN